MGFNPEFYQNFKTIDPQSLLLAFYGGITIAIAASLYYTFYGKILGMSGLIGQVVKANITYQTRRSLTIICGLIFSSAFIFYMSQNSLTDYFPFDTSTFGTNTQFMVAGFLVGVGTQLASGCTSGHGLCGLPRLSVRSITAVMIFLITGLLTATFEIPKLINANPVLQSINVPLNVQPIYYLIGTCLIPLICFIFSQHKSFGKFIKTCIYFFIGSIFGMGLMLAGMSKRQKIYGFLELNTNWDPSLFVVLMTGVAFNLLIFTLMRKAIKKPFFESELSDPHHSIDWKLIIGSFLFGLGWGIGGICPGPFLLLIPLNNLRIPLFWGSAFIVGMKITQIFTQSKQSGSKQNKIKTN